MFQLDDWIDVRKQMTVLNFEPNELAASSVQTAELVQLCYLLNAGLNVRRTFLMLVWLSSRRLVDCRRVHIWVPSDRVNSWHAQETRDKARADVAKIQEKKAIWAYTVFYCLPRDSTYFVPF